MKKACRFCGYIHNEHSYHKCTICNKRDACKICQSIGAHPNAQHTSTYGKCKQSSKIYGRRSSCWFACRPFCRRAKEFNSIQTSFLEEDVYTSPWDPIPRPDPTLRHHGYWALKESDNLAARCHVTSSSFDNMQNMAKGLPPWKAILNQCW